MRNAYRGDPEFRNYVQYALSMPHINSMPQAIAYATAELAARSRRDTDRPLPDIRGRQGPEAPAWGQGPRAQSRGSSDFKRGRGSSKGFDAFSSQGKGSIPGLDAVKQAVADVADWAGEKILPAGSKAVSTATKDVIRRGSNWAKDLNS